MERLTGVKSILGQLLRVLQLLLRTLIIKLNFPFISFFIELDTSIYCPIHFIFKIES